MLKLLNNYSKFEYELKNNGMCIHKLKNNIKS